MQLGIIGLGRMGANMARRLIRAGHEVVVFNRTLSKVNELVAEGAVGASSLDELVTKLAPPRVFWIMVPAGAVTEQTIAGLSELVEAKDIIIDGGNTYFKDDIRRASSLAARQIHYLDVGTSGGIWGLERGYCLMIGGEEQVVRYLQPIFESLSPGRGQIPPTDGIERLDSTADQGYLHCGPAGAGHFVKMIHNGIEYGLMQAYAEGFELLRSARPSSGDYHYEFKLGEIAELWRRGSVISSWLLDLSAVALTADGELGSYSGHVEDSGEGRWTIQAAIEQATPATVLTSALFTRFRSRQEHGFAEKVLSAMRHQFGGHSEPTPGSGEEKPS